MYALYPSQVTLEADEIHRINRAELAMLLHKLPHEIDAAPPNDIEDMIAVKSMRDTIAARKSS